MNTPTYDPGPGYRYMPGSGSTGYRLDPEFAAGIASCVAAFEAATPAPGFFARIARWFR
jgi:hypothetical protein